MRYLFIILLFFVGCQSEQLYCAEGLHQPDGLHLHYSEIEQAKEQVIPFTPPQKYEFYVVTLSKCSSGFCIEDYTLGDLHFTGDAYILNNGCHTK